MKRIFLLMIAGGALLFNCNNQKEESPAAKAGYRTFEEKQKIALSGDKREDYKGKVDHNNLRYPAAKATPGVVHIKSVFTVNADPEIPDFFKDFFDDDFLRQNFPRDGGRQQKRAGSASGVIISNDGYIVTNNHVVNKAGDIEVILYDQRSYKAKIVGADPTTDLALLKIEEGKLPFIEFGNSDSLEVGDVVLAVGNPFNLASTVTAGIVSAKARNIHVITNRWAVESYIQTDAAMNPGNSGGALVDINGKLVGITAAIASPNGAYAGYSFAIPVNIVKKTVDDLLRYGKILHGYMGIAISDMNGDRAKKLGIGTTTGVVVEGLQPDGGAMKAGIQINDVITRIGDRSIEATPQLQETIARARPGEKLQVTIIRNGKERTITVTLMPTAQKGPGAFSEE